MKFHFLKGIEREGESEIEREKNERVRARLQCFAERKWELEWVLLHNAVEGKLELEGTKAYTYVSILGHFLHIQTKLFEQNIKTCNHEKHKIHNQFQEIFRCGYWQYGEWFNDRKT